MTTDDHYARQIAFLRAVDDALASREGLRRESIAEAQGVTTRTVHRAITGIRASGMEIVSQRVRVDGACYYVYRYAGKRRLFATD